MTERASARANVIVLLAILTVSAGTMLWLFWRFPVTTAIITVAVLAILVLLAALARSIEVETLEGDRLRITTLGRPFLRNACVALDQRLREQKPDTRIFSQAL